MSLENPFKKDNETQIDKSIGSAYKYVKAVATNLAYLKYLAQFIDDKFEQLVEDVKSAAVSQAVLNAITAQTSVVLDEVADIGLDAQKAEDAAAQALAVARLLVSEYHIGFSFSSSIESGTNIGSWICPKQYNVQFPEGLKNSTAYAAVAPAANATFLIKKNNEEVGQLKFTANENIAELIIVDDSFGMTPNDVLNIIAPNPKDPNLAGVTMTLVGHRTPWEN